MIGIVRNFLYVIPTVAALATTVPGWTQEQRGGKIDVEHYTIEAEINPRAQTVTATAQVRFVPLDNASAASFELNNALNVSRIADSSGRQIPASRSQQDSAVRLSF